MRVRLQLFALLLSGLWLSLLEPALADEPPNCPAPPLQGRPLYLRGSFNGWTAADAQMFCWRCDRYTLVAPLQGDIAFKVGDEEWSADADWGRGDGDRLEPRGGELKARVNGPTLFTLWLDDLKHPRLQFEPAGAKPPANTCSEALPGPTDPVALSVRYNSRDLADKRPFGAVPTGQELQFTLRAMPGVEAAWLVVEQRTLIGNQDKLSYQELTRVPLQPAADGPLQRWSGSYTLAQPGVYGYWFALRIAGKDYVYQNNRDPIFWTREKGSGGLGEIAPAPAQPRSIRRYRQTVVSPDFLVPAWAADAVTYAIFPDRFRSESAHNARLTSDRRYQNHSIEVHPHWLEAPYKPASGDGSDAVYNNDFFGGDLDGIRSQLPMLRKLGVNLLYLTPIFQAASNHRYDTADYLKIDPILGNQADLQRLTREARRLGMRVLLDASLNHTGSDSRYFNRYGNFPDGGAYDQGHPNPASPYSDWYRFNTGDEVHPYQGWLGVEDLPETNKDSASFRDFAFGPRGVMQHWLDQGAAGWRMDVAPWVSDDFWRAWRRAIKQHQPDALTVAETWFDASKFLVGDMFDATMNYIFHDTVLAYANGGDARALYANLEHVREAYPPQALHALMNLLSSHDQPRALHVLGWDGDTSKTDAMQAAKARLRLALWFQMTYPGAPSVYYGDEVGVSGGDDPYNRATYPWPDRGGKPDLRLRSEVQRLIALRQRLPILRRGTLGAPLLLDEHVIALPRELGTRHAIVLSNNDTMPLTRTVALPTGWEARPWRDAVSGERLRTAAGHITIVIPAQSGLVLLDR